jgi:hypothetical protein
MDILDTDSLERIGIARELLSRGIDPVDLELHPDLTALPAALATTKVLNIPFPAGLNPQPVAPDPNTDTEAPLESADVLLITWTVDEQDALADVFTPQFGRKTWTRYNRNFSEYADQIRPGAPASLAKRLGSWCRTRIGGKAVLCYKSELHLNQDGITNFHGSHHTTLPVRGMLAQLINEVQPKVVITTGTAGGVYDDDDLGDVVVTRGAKFRLRKEFGNEDFANETYRSEWEIPRTHLQTAVTFMRIFQNKLQEGPILGPTIRHLGQITSPLFVPSIRIDWGEGDDIGDEIFGMAEFHPILTTDFFEYGTSTNGLQLEGCGVEMGDAVLGMVSTNLGADEPKWVVVRNASDPQINGNLARDLQMAWAVHFYKKYGYWTSINSALTCWAIVAGLS